MGLKKETKIFQESTIALVHIKQMTTVMQSSPNVIHTYCAITAMVLIFRKFSGIRLLSRASIQKQPTPLNSETINHLPHHFSLFFKTFKNSRVDYHKQSQCMYITIYYYNLINHFNPKFN